MIDSFVKFVQGIVRIKGNTDGTAIGNVGDKLKVTDESTIDTSTRYEQCTLARGTNVTNTWVDAYAYTGAGKLHGLLLNLDDSSFSRWDIRVVVDGTDVLFSTEGLSTEDTNENTLFDIADLAGLNAVGLSHHDDVIRIEPFKPFTFSTSVSIKIRRNNNTDTFRAGFVLITKDS